MNFYNPYYVHHPYIPYRPFPATGTLPLASSSKIRKGGSGENSKPSSQSDEQMDKGKSKEEQQKQGDGKSKEQGKKQQNPKNAMISFDTLKVGTVSSSSGIFNGKNIQFGWSSHSKSNTGFGSLSGHDNKVNKNTNVVFDNDQLDTPIDDRDTMWSPIPTT